MIAEIGRHAALQTTPEGRDLAADLERRICEAAATTDRLFAAGVAAVPMRERLRSLGVGMIALFAAADQEITLEVEVAGDCPEVRHDVIVRVAHELVGNALKHGMALLRQGTIEIALITASDGTTRLAVRDNGWGLLEHSHAGDGCALVRALAAPHGGDLVLSRRDQWTEAVVTLPGPAAGPITPASLACILALLALISAGIAAADAARTAFHPYVASRCIASSILLSGKGCALQTAGPEELARPIPIATAWRRHGRARASRVG